MINIIDENGSQLSAVYQWDTGRSVCFSGTDPDASYEVHYSIDYGRSSAYVILPELVEGTLTAEVPDEIMTQEQDIRVYLVKKGPNGRKTVAEFRVQMIARAKPDNYALNADYRHVLELMGDLEDLATDDTSSLVAAVNSILSAGGSGRSQKIYGFGSAEEYEDWLEDNPTAVQTGDIIILKETVGLSVSWKICQRNIGGTDDLKMTIPAGEMPAGLTAILTAVGQGWHTNKSSAEIYSAYSAGVAVSCLTPDGYILPLSRCSQSEARFMGPTYDIDDGTMTHQIWRISGSSVSRTVRTNTDDEVAQALLALQLGKGDNLYFDDTDNLLYLMSGGEIIGDGVAVSVGGGGGGGGGNTYTYSITLQNLMDSRSITAAAGASVNLSFRYTSVDGDSVDDGPGTGTVTVGGVNRGTFRAVQGENSLDISPYLSEGENTVRIKVENSEGSVRTLAYSVNVVSLSISTTMDAMAVYSGDVNVYYTLVGAGEKTVHFEVDGEDIGTQTVTASGRSQTYTIPEQDAGAHILRIYAELTVDDMTVTSEVITLGMIWTGDGTAPVVLSTFDKPTATQGELLSIPYMVYSPTSEAADVVLSVIADGETYSTTTLTGVDRLPRTWSIDDYPAGTVTFRIACGTTVLNKTISVAEYVLPVQPVTDGLVLEFSAAGRSNAEENPEQWNYGAIAASFDGFGWSGSDGWVEDADGVTVLRFLPGDEMTIPLQPFAADARETGYTIEVELATRDVRDYDAVAFSCLSGGRGVKIASQEASLTSEQSAVSMLFKEDSRVRVSFVIEQRNLNRLIYIYVGGILCGCTQYPTNDNFAQASPVGLTIGSETCGIDLYKIRCYSKGLNRAEQLDNYIVDRSTLAERIAAASRNDILDQNDEVTIEKLPLDLPYLIMECPELPAFKGDKKTGVSLTFVDQAHSEKCWTAHGVELDVQGTSSAGYPVKNEKLKLKQGIVYGNGDTAPGVQISPGGLPTKTICIKVDFASSEGANNICLVDYYNELCPYRTPPQEEDPRVRQAVEGFAIALFWQNTNTGEVTFVGKGNFNTDKGNPEIFGFTEEYPNAQSWEFLNNTSDRTLFHRSDFGSGWLDDFEARYPDGNTTDFANYKRVCDWVVSTDRDAAGLTDAQKAARLAKFAEEFESYFCKDAMLFYYLFTEVFLMVDSRAKNMFLTTYDGTHWLPLPYDMDTAIGINNEGALAFSYELEDTDTVGGANVFNGQTSTLWKNVRDAFGDELKEMYADLRSGGRFSYEAIRDKMAAHQAVWPEALWNEDAFRKYLQPFLLRGENYLSMLQGSKYSQRDWWLFYAFRYRDSKYQTGDASANFITLRAYAVGNITLTPYSNIWPRVKYGSNTAFCRGWRNQEYEMECTLDNMDDTEVYIYSADLLSSIGNLSHLLVGYANFSMATKLQSIILGSSASGYTNPKLTEVYVGNNNLLTEVNVQNCTALTMPIDLTGCASLETFLAGGSAITGVNLPNGGRVQELELPGTVTNLTLLNLKDLETLSVDGYSALTTLRVENTPNVPLQAIINNATNLNRVRLVGVEWTASNESSLQATIDRLETCIGMDASGNNTEHAVVTGRVNISSISSTLLAQINESFPELTVVVGGVAQYLVRFLNYDGSLLYSETVAEGGNAIDPVTAGYITTPTKPGSDEVHYAFGTWSALPTNVQSNQAVTAVYATTYRVRYQNWDGTTLQTVYVLEGSSSVYSGTTPTRPQTAQYTYTFTGWGSQTNITSARDIMAQYSAIVRKYTVYFYNGATLLQTVQNVSYGGSATYTGATPVDPSGNNMPFEAWSPAPTNIQGNTSCYAQFQSPVEIAEITDSWDTIIAKIEDGTYKTAYKVGNYKPINLGTEGIINMQIAAIDEDDLASGGKAPLTFIGMELLNTSQQMNPSRSGSSGAYDEGTGAIGGWEKSEMRAYLKNTVKPLIPSAVRSSIVEVTKTQRSYNSAGSSETQTTHDDVWIPSWDEISSSSAMYVTLFPDNASRIKYKVGESSAYSWWTRQANSTNGFDCVTTSGSFSYNVAIFPDGVALGFCLGNTKLITDSWDTILANVQNGTYSTKYAIGQYKPLDLGTEGIVNMQIAAFDTDDKADGSGKAPITWISKELLNTRHRMNPAKAGSSGAYTEGTGQIGGWQHCEMRSYLRTTVKPLIPSNVRSAIVEVTKTQDSYNTAGTKETQTTTDDVWIPKSSGEITGTAPLYATLFTDNASRIKHKVGSSSASSWWTRSPRSPSGTGDFISIDESGSTGSIHFGALGVALGFCT